MFEEIGARDAGLVQDPTQPLARSDFEAHWQAHASLVVVARSGDDCRRDFVDPSRRPSKAPAAFARSSLTPFAVPQMVGTEVGAMDDESAQSDGGQAKARREYLIRTLQSMTSVAESLEEAIAGLQRMGGLPSASDMPTLQSEIMLAASELLGRDSKEEDFQGSSLEELLVRAKQG